MATLGPDAGFWALAVYHVPPLYERSPPRHYIPKWLVWGWQPLESGHYGALTALGGDMSKVIRALGGGLATTLAVFQPAVAQAQSALADPRGSGPIVSAVQWLQGTLLGTVATVIAVIAVACVGLLMLTGRLNWRYGAIVILGCFILFGAVGIVAGIQTTATFAG